MADVIQLYSGTDAVSREGFNDRFDAINRKFEEQDQERDRTEAELTAHAADAVKHVTAAERTAWNGKATPANVDTKIAALKAAANTWTGVQKVAAATDYTTGRLRNIFISTAAPLAAEGGNGDIWIVRESGG